MHRSIIAILLGATFALAPVLPESAAQNKFSGQRIPSIPGATFNPAPPPPKAPFTSQNTPSTPNPFADRKTPLTPKAKFTTKKTPPTPKGMLLEMKEPAASNPFAAQTTPTPPKADKFTSQNTPQRPNPFKKQTELQTPAVKKALCKKQCEAKLGPSPGIYVCVHLCLQQP
jgi:hypothetical protein